MAHFGITAPNRCCLPVKKSQSTRRQETVQFAQMSPSEWICRSLLTSKKDHTRVIVKLHLNCNLTWAYLSTFCLEQKELWLFIIKKIAIKSSPVKCISAKEANSKLYDITPSTPLTRGGWLEWSHDCRHIIKLFPSHLFFVVDNTFVTSKSNSLLSLYTKYRKFNNKAPGA